MDHEEEIRTWRDWFSIIREEVWKMLVSRQVWKRYGEIVNSNPEIQSPSNFHRWVTGNYIAAQSLAVRRQTDPGPRSVSLQRLLSRVAEVPEVLSRERYLSLQGGDSMANGWFDAVSGPGQPHIHPDVAKDDLKTLKSKADRVRILVNKRIAHWDEVEYAAAGDITVGEVHESIDYLVTLLQKYGPVIIGSIPGDNVSEPAWWSIFYRPWIEEEAPSLGDP